MRHAYGLLLLLALGGTPALAETAGATQPPVLKSAVTVTGDLVRIGDLVSNAGAVADKAIFRAPDLGQTGTVQAHRVLEAIRAHGLANLQTGGISEVLVTRDSRVIPVSEIESRIARAIAEQYGMRDPDMLAVTLDRGAEPIHVETRVTADLVVSRAVYDTRSNRFDVTFEIPGSAAAQRLPLRYTGIALEMVDAIALAKPLGRGDIIRDADILVERRPKADLGTDPITNRDQVLGLALRRSMRAGQLLQRTDLMKPELVLRNEPVTIVYRTPGISLTIRGKALETGTEGDIVNVVNVQSKRTIQGTVTGYGHVSVFTPARLAASQALPTGRAAGARTE
jgi:flagella basal body P-ring formation protein FlgA